MLCPKSTGIVQLIDSRLENDMTQGIGFLDIDGVRDLSTAVLDDRGRLQVMPHSFYAQTTTEERALFCVRQGLYLLPTHNLIEHLKWIIGDRSCIEIGAGNGVLAEALGIPATDNFQQNMAAYKELYEAMGQTVVPYGHNVINMDAHEAVDHFNPDVVVASWVTHLYDPAYPELGGNELGVREQDVLRGREYIFIGNEKVHQSKQIWDIPYFIEYPRWLHSRAFNGSRNFIATWNAT